MVQVSEELLRLKEENARYKEALKEIASCKGDYYLDEVATIAEEALK